MDVHLDTSGATGARRPTQNALVPEVDEDETDDEIEEGRNREEDMEAIEAFINAPPGGMRRGTMMNAMLMINNVMDDIIVPRREPKREMNDNDNLEEEEEIKRQQRLRNRAHAVFGIPFRDELGFGHNVRDLDTLIENINSLPNALKNRVWRLMRHTGPKKAFRETSSEHPELQTLPQWLKDNEHQSNFDNFV
ncbi:unnamed protein product [Caenorhabditis brenneri]